MRIPTGRLVAGIALATLGAGGARAQGAPAAWEFEGIGIAANPDCIGQVLTEWKYSWLRKDPATFDEDKLRFRDSVTKAEKRSVVIMPIPVKGEKDLVIAVVKKQTLCMTASGTPKFIDSYEYVHGPTPQAIVQQLQMRLQLVQPAQEKDFSIIEFIKIQVKESLKKGGAEPVYTRETVAIGVRG